MIYKKIPRKHDRRCKLTSKNIIDIKRMYAEGAPSTILARLFNVTPSTILYHANPERKRKQDELNKKLMKKYQADPENKKILLDRQRKHKAHRKKILDL